MRVRELLAANAFCLLALTIVGCKAVEQPVGEYGAHVRPEKPSSDLPHPAGSHSESAAGTDAAPLSDAGTSSPEIEDAAFSSPTDAGPLNGGPSTWLPPMLLDAGVSSTPSNVACTVIEAQRRRLDMYLMVDSNITVSATGVWEVMTDGITRFVGDQRSSGTGVGIRYFGYTCDPGEYAQPTVDVDVLPKNASAIIASTRARRWSASPMLPALQGAITFDRTRARLHPEAKQVVALVSDGFAQDFTCPYSTQQLADAAHDGVIGFPSIETHVIAVGVNTTVSQPLDQLIEFLGAFNAIADAGGSGQAVTTEITGDAAGFSEALQRVRRNAMPCEFAAPNAVALGDFGVARFPIATELPRVTNERGCDSQQGWYYAIESSPTPVTLCPATCDWLREADDHAIGLLTGCAAKP
jgi:hypothetical protein